MSTPSADTHPAKSRSLSIVHLLEHGDGIAHVLVAVLLLLLAVGILVSSTYGFVSGWIAHPATEDFAAKALIYLSDLLFGVIVLELLSTILTYIQARNLEATIKDFLVVGLISSIRKILLVGAQSSLEKATGNEFLKEALGTVISIIGILLLIGGLLLLDRRSKARKLAEEGTAS
jgi:uncharacterized membrane protein (DUF373 family)